MRDVYNVSHQLTLQEYKMGMVLVDQGALKMALNVLRRAGKVEVADALEQSAQDVHSSTGNTDNLPSFQSEADAFDWMEEQVDDPCQDNERFAYQDDEVAMANYDHKQSTGCCGFFDARIIIDGRPALIGCNYGH